MTIFADPTDPENKRCRTCRYWDAHSIDFKLGDCKVPGDHRYWRHKLATGGMALLDSFGREETKPSFGCARWEAPTQPLVDG